MEESNDTSHIPTIQSASLEDEEERNMSEVSQKGKLSMLYGEGSSKQTDHSNTISPLTTDISKVFHDFWIVGEVVQQVISTRP